ncbi:hypothetical protein DFH94DRAFT_684653 [Russula ochroleuca]|uniref:Uncharacterized protein n=1 Tax=Russula ochroleuca TaxID=152965 RepID=A0A9P5MQY1_9AGAM|nr:hypothetical protein DFH94DRAFT_684653 [Russula ochroleuca]
MTDRHHRRQSSNNPDTLESGLPTSNVACARYHPQSPDSATASAAQTAADLNRITNSLPLNSSEWLLSARRSALRGSPPVRTSPSLTLPFSRSSLPNGPDIYANSEPAEETSEVHDAVFGLVQEKTC